MANNRVVHFEIPADQPEALIEFYKSLFGWKFDKAPMPPGAPDYWFCNTGTDGPGISGGLMNRMDPRQPVTNYVDVASIDEKLAETTKLGGQIALPKQTIPGMGAYAAIVDPQGNICGLWETAK